MTHPVEIRTWNIVLKTLSYLDPNKRGWFVDAGAGEDAFYFEWLHNHGWKGVVIEPFPTQQVRDLCNRYGVHLAQCALWTDNSVASICLYPGGINAIQPIWNGNHQSAIIQRRTLAGILNNLPEKPPAISLLKLDVEGAEPYIINNLFPLRSDWYPWIIVAEFGGQTTAHSRIGAWSEAHTSRIFKALRSLYRHDFKQVVMVGENPVTRDDVKTLNGGMLAKNDRDVFDYLFNPTDTWGNMVILPEVFSADQLIEWAALEPQYS